MILTILLLLLMIFALVTGIFAVQMIWWALTGNFNVQGN